MAQPGLGPGRGPYDREVTVAASSIEPQVSWGTSPEDVLPISGAVPDPAEEADADRRAAMERSLAYMGLAPGTRLRDIPVDCVFIGSCTNGRIEDLRAVAGVAEGRRVADGVRAMVVPGSGLVKKQAEAEGLDRILRAAGFDWREPRLLHVPGDECRQAGARRTLRLHLEPQFRGPPGPRRTHPSGQSGHGRRGGDSRHAGRRARAGLRTGRGSVETFTTLTGVAAPLPMINVDTDMIIPKQHLKTIRRTGLGRPSLRRAAPRRGRPRES